VLAAVIGTRIMQLRTRRSATSPNDVAVTAQEAG